MLGKASFYAIQPLKQFLEMRSPDGKEQTWQLGDEPLAGPLEN